jgi:hypothetical protein
VNFLYGAPPLNPREADLTDTAGEAFGSEDTCKRAASGPARRPVQILGFSLAAHSLPKGTALVKPKNPRICGGFLSRGARI